MVITCTVEPDQALESKLSDPFHQTLLIACRNINIPWPTKGMGDADYLYAFQQVVMPVAYKFDPDLVISKCPTCNKTGRLITSSCCWLRRCRW